jgi:anti-anti-sigma factor
MSTLEKRLESGTWIEHGPLTIRVEDDPAGLCMIELFGEFDLAGTEVAARELERAADGDVNEIIVDLSGLDFIDSSGLRVLCHACARESRGADRLRLLRGRGPVERIFKLTGLDATLPFAD